MSLPLVTCHSSTVRRSGPLIKIRKIPTLCIGWRVGVAGQLLSVLLAKPPVRPQNQASATTLYTTYLRRRFTHLCIVLHGPRCDLRFLHVRGYGFDDERRHINVHRQYQCCEEIKSKQQRWWWNVSAVEQVILSSQIALEFKLGCPVVSLLNTLGPDERR